MDEYIEREALERIFEERYLYYRKRSQREFPGYIQVDESLTVAAMIMESCLDSLRNAPAADVAPVRHGRWEWCKDYDGNSILVCSECSRVCCEDDAPYCYCGAKMDLSDECKQEEGR